MSGLLGTSEEATEAAASMSFLVLLPFLARDRISTPLSLLSLSLSLSISLSVWWNICPLLPEIFECESECPGAKCFLTHPNLMWMFDNLLPSWFNSMQSLLRTVHEI